MTIPAGEGHPSAKITEDQVREIRRLIKEGTLTQSAIAERFGVDRTTICNIKKGKTWAHVDKPVRKEVVYGPVECPHDGGHVHGTHSAYVVDKCRCQECVEEHSSYMRRRREMMKAGTWQNHLYDPEPLQKHLQMLARCGIGAVQLAQLTGLSDRTYWRVMGGYRVQRRTATRILSVKPDMRNAAPGAWIDATGTRRRLQALIAMGWSQTALRPLLGLAEGTIENIHTQKTVRVKTARIVAGLYDRLWDKPAPAGRNRDCALGMARRRGFVLPLAWDDDEIDDPAAKPHGEWRAVA
jgi:hypothetical protein